MRRTKSEGSARRNRHFAALVAALLVGTAEALAQEQQAGRAAPGAQQNNRPARRIVVSLAQRKLALVEEGRLVKTYRVAVGAPASPTPAGEFRIVHRIPQPTYYAAGNVVPSGEENPLGTRWLGLSRKGYGIHGTNEPRSIGRRASHGCIRMRNHDVEELFALVRIGDVVELYAETPAELEQIFGAAGAAVAGG